MVEREVPVEVEVPVVKNLVVNNLRECAASFGQETDYLPDKTESQYANEWELEYFNSYRALTVDTDTGPDARNLVQYVRVQSGGTPEPEPARDPADAMVAQAVAMDERPGVMHGQISQSGSWFTFGPDRIDYHLIRDAGGTPALIDADLALVVRSAGTLWLITPCREVKHGAPDMYAVQTGKTRPAKIVA